MIAFCIILGSSLMVWGALWLAAWMVKLLTWQTTIGFVVRLDDGVEIGDKHPRVQFSSPDGREIEFTSRYGVQFLSLWQSGSTVRVLFHPRCPEKAVIYSLWNAATPLFIAAFGALFFYMGYTGLP